MKTYLPIILTLMLASSMATAAVTVRLSVDSAGAQGNAASGIDSGASVSADGRYVAFESAAGNLVSGDSNGWQDIFVIDRNTGQVSRVSVATSGTQGDRASMHPCISADGRFVAFESCATNLVSGDTNGACDIFVRDRQTNTTTRASVVTGGAQANGSSFSPTLSSDGRYVAFFSTATNLVSGDTNSTSDVFVRDCQTGETTRVSISTSGTQGDWASQAPSISGDGRYVAFESLASNLVSGDTNDTWDVFLRDRQLGTTIRASVAGDGTQGNAYSVAPSLSSDGRYVAFESLASNLVAGDSNGDSDILVVGLQAGTVTLASVTTGGVQADGESFRPGISGDGNSVAFESSATNLVAGDSNECLDVFLHDRNALTTTRISVASDGSQAGDPSGGWGFSAPALDAGGRVAAFVSSAANLVAGDTNGVWDVFVRDLREKVATPLFDPDGGSFVSPPSVAITCATPGAAIHYTLDGVPPTESAPIYTAPIQVDTSLTLKAAAWRDGWIPSDVKASAFEIVGPTEYATDAGFIRPGWNLVSVPADPINGDPLVVFSGIDVANSSFQYWRSGIDGGGFQSYGELFGWTGPLVRGTPYWFVQSAGNVVIRYIGMPPVADAELTIPAHGSAPFWIMFGTPFPSVISTDSVRFKNVSKRGDVWLDWPDAFSQTDAGLRIIDSNAQGWAMSVNSYITITPSAWAGRHQFDPWWGYWLLVHDPGELKIKFPRP